MHRSSRTLSAVLVGCLVGAAQAAGAEEAARSITTADALVRTDPPELKSTGTLLSLGMLVEVLDERTNAGKAYVKVKEHQGAMKVLGWIAKSNLGSPKEFDPAMKPDDAIALDQLAGLELTMASIYNTRGKYLKDNAAKIGLTGAVLAAVLKVESNGHGFGNDGRTIIRFENHIFRSQWGAANSMTFDKFFKCNAKQGWKGQQWRKDETAAWEACHKNQAEEWDVLTFARTLDETAALKSASFGAGQIMGFNHKSVGYVDVQTMVKKFDEGIKPQLDAVIAFIKANDLCMKGLRAGDYVMFARGYNGAGQASAYAGRIQDAAGAYKKVTIGMKCSD
jgi:hypothetical protein